MKQEKIKQKISKSMPLKSPSKEEINEFLLFYNSGLLNAAEEMAKRFTKKFPNYSFSWKAMGVIALKFGRLQDALTSMQKVVDLEPNDIEANFNLGIVLMDLGQISKAEIFIRKVIELDPDNAEAHNNLGTTLMELGRMNEAEKSYLKAIELKPSYVEAYSNLGANLTAQGYFERAVKIYSQAIMAEPNYAELHNNLAAALMSLGKPNEAENRAREAIRLRPDYQEAYSNLGDILRVLGRLSDAEDYCRFAIGLSPDYAFAHGNLGAILKRQGRLTEAETSTREAIRLRSDYPEAFSTLSAILLDFGRFREAEASAREAIRLSSGFAEAYNNLAISLKLQGSLFEAEENFRQAIHLKPDYPEVHCNLGNIYVDLCRLCDALSSFDNAIRIEPDNEEANSSKLFCLNYDESIADTELFEQAKQYGAVVSSNAKNKYSAWGQYANMAKIRVGFVSGDFRQHAVWYFLEGLLKNLDREEFELIAFPTTSKADDLTTKIMSCFDQWTPITGKSNEEAARLIYRSEIQVLIDLSGHTAHNRLPVFSYRPAPVQATWIGYPNTTGVPEIDIRFVDSITDPENASSNFASEQLIRLERCFLNYSPPREVPLPLFRSDEVGPIFGSANNFIKVGPETVQLWARVLHEVPGSKLALKSAWLFNSTPSGDAVRSAFKKHGVAADRLIFYKRAMSIVENFEFYNHIDVALDPLNYNGTTTTCEALWMGVPVVSLIGARHAARVGASLLTAADMSDLIVSDANSYVAKVAELAEDRHALNVRRIEQRRLLMETSLLDSRSFAKGWAHSLKGVMASKGLTVRSVF